MNVSVKIFFRQMLRGKVRLLSLTLALLTLTGCSIHFHSWKPATCVSPKTCIECGKVKGETLRHEITEDSICKMCNKTIPTVLNLSQVQPTTPVLYGGVCLQLTVVDSNPQSEGTMFPGVYTIYDENGAFVIAGDWTPFVGKDHPAGEYTSFTKDSSFIPLEPGAYTVIFSYYKSYKYDEINKVFLPDSVRRVKSREFIVE